MELQSFQPYEVMDIFWVVLVIVGLLAVFLLVSAYLDWRDSQTQYVGRHVAQTSFQENSGDLLRLNTCGKPDVVLSVVIPAYNEEYRLPLMLDETLTYLDARVAANPNSFSYEVIVVDDGSTDGTHAAALAARPKTPGRGLGELRVIQLQRNHGKGFAVKTGMLAGRGQFLLMADADGATNIHDLEKLEASMRRKVDGGAVNIVFGSRHHLKDVAISKRPWYRNILMRSLHIILAVLIGGGIQDTQCGFKLFRASVGKQVFASLHLCRWAFDIEIVILACKLQEHVIEVPVTFTDMPGSKLNLALGAVTMLRDIIAVRLFYGLGVWQPSIIP